jgi:hypothetical protein
MLSDSLEPAGKSVAPNTGMNFGTNPIGVTGAGLF